MWATYFQYQVNLCNFLSAALCRLGEHQLPPQKEFVIGGGFRDGGNAVTVTRGQCREVQALWSSHEEADTRMILHAKYAARTDRRLVIQSPHTDVFILIVANLEVWDVQNCGLDWRTENKWFQCITSPMLWVKSFIDLFLDSMQSRAAIRPAFWRVLGRRRLGIVFVVVLTTRIACLTSERNKNWT